MAVKQIAYGGVATPSESALHTAEALQGEVGCLQALSHPNIVRYLGVERDDTEGHVSIFLEYCAGGSIASLLERFGAFNESLSRTYITMVLEGLAYLHGRQMMHRDIKGANVLVDAEGVCKLADFGASKMLQQDLSASGDCRSLRGTPYWMAPEVIKQTGHSFPADVWSVGCVLVEMLTGKPPWSHFTSQISALFHIASSKAPPPLPPGISPSAVDFLLLTFKRNPRERPAASYLLGHVLVRDERQQRLAPPKQQLRPVSQVVSHAQAAAVGSEAGGKEPQTVTSAVKRGDVFFVSHCRPTPSRTHDLGPKGMSQPQPGQHGLGVASKLLTEVGPSSAAPYTRTAAAAAPLAASPSAPPQPPQPQPPQPQLPSRASPKPSRASPNPSSPHPLSPSRGAAVEPPGVPQHTSTRIPLNPARGATPPLPRVSAANHARGATPPQQTPTAPAPSAAAAAAAAASASDADAADADADADATDAARRADAEPEAGVIYTEAAAHEARQRKSQESLVAADKEKKRRLWEEELERELEYQKEQKLLTKAT